MKMYPIVKYFSHLITNYLPYLSQKQIMTYIIKHDTNFKKIYLTFLYIYIYISKIYTFLSKYTLINYIKF